MADEKLVPEWGVVADDQIALVGFLVVLAAIVGFGWLALTGDGTGTGAGDGTGTAASAEAAGADRLEFDGNGLREVAADFDISARANEGRAILTGTIDNTDLRAEAGTRAAAVAGITSVDNRLRIADDRSNDRESGNDDGHGDGSDLASEADPTTTPPTTEAATTTAPTTAAPTTAAPTTSEAPTTTSAPTTAAPTTTEADATTLTTADADVTSTALDELVNLSPIVFQTNTDQFAANSTEVVAQAAAIMAGSDRSFEIRGFTDTQGDAAANMALSQARADAVRDALIQQGIAAERLSAVGYGETTQFRQGTSPEALAANRRVDFVAR